MTREIKFRAKDEKGRWQYSNDEAEFWYGISDGQYDRESLCQFTGLRDKNGKEIYEGDIVKGGWDCENGRIVEFLDGGFEPFARNSGEDGERSQWVEVIGNIYENPDLLIPNH